ncbi:chorismate--pyruvate lyase family protein [Gilvimarinus xylanilyticus]|uniref:Probable chorismate pyruvate-lyase n=1 Tax=Gilvimarinus xylanilyticus TaxID=2944139 RepID=A0A9X2I652_9GAMM|nr:chorismate lyase [Gilvimarinus xylanilyticus]MCP8901010.1 chorismate lyase [Gilvimarinus xylanilyticus]
MPPANSQLLLNRRFARRGLGLWQRAPGGHLLPAGVRPWLLDPGSLTRKLRQLSHNQLSVHILRQSWGRPRLSEARALGVDITQHGLIREVILCGPYEEPWVYARSLFPAASLTGSLRHLRQLDNRPLGGYLFSHPHLGRSPLSVAALPPGSGVPESLQGDKLLWGRRSVFSLKGKQLLVSEVFLPAFAARFFTEEDT